MATYNLTANTTLTTSYSGNTIVKGGAPGLVLRPYYNGNVWYLRDWDTGANNWASSYFTGGDNLNLNGKQLTLGMSILTPSQTPAQITTTNTAGNIVLQPGSFEINAHLQAQLSIFESSNGYTITINGSVYNPSNYMFIINMSSTAALVVNGTVIGGPSPYSRTIYMTGGTAVINGSVYGNQNGPGGVGIDARNSAEITITGDVFGGSDAGSHGCYVANSAAVTAYGDVIGGQAADAYGIFLVSSTSSATIRGNIKCGTQSNKAPGVSGLVNGLTFDGYFQIYSGGVAYNMYKTCPHLLVPITDNILILGE